MADLATALDSQAERLEAAGLDAAYFRDLAAELRARRKGAVAPAKGATPAPNYPPVPPSDPTPPPEGHAEPRIDARSLWNEVVKKHAEAKARLEEVMRTVGRGLDAEDAADALALVRAEARDLLPAVEHTLGRPLTRGERERGIA